MNHSRGPGHGHTGGNNQQGFRQGGGQYEKRSELPPLPSFKVKIFKDDLLAELIKSEVQEIAKRFVQEKGRSKDERNCNKNSQVRRFYDELVRLQRDIKNEEDFNNLLPAIYMVVSKCAYAKGRGLVSDTFYEFVQKNVRAVEKLDDLKNCIMYFEAVLGYYKLENPNKD